MALFTVLAAWGMITAVFVGIGLGTRRILKQKTLDNKGILDSFWLGFAAVIAVLQIWHFLWPVTAAAGGLLAVLGLAGLITGFRQLGSCILRLRGSDFWWLAVMTLFALWLGNLATGPLRAYDTGLYHLPMVEWIRQFPIVPGLGNLHGRLAFNNSNLMYAAVLEFGPWAKHSAVLAHGPLIVFGFAQGLRGVIGMMSRSNDKANEDAGLVVLLPLILFVVTNRNWFPGLYGDLPVAILCILGGTRTLNLLRKRPTAGQPEAYTGIWIIALLTTAICIKLSVAVFSAVTMVLIWIFWLSRTKRTPGNRVFGIVGKTAVVLILIGPWAARGAVLSGYPLYPVTLLSIKSDWQVPPEKATQDRLWVQSWARRPDADITETRGWKWLGGWARRMVKEQKPLIVVPFVLSLMGLCFAALWRPLDRIPLKKDPGWLMLIPLAAGLGVWFWTGPNVRFATTFVWFSAALSLSQIIRAVAPRAVVRRAILVVLGLLFIWPLAHKNPFQIDRGGYDFDSSPVAEMDIFVTDSGLKLYVPTTGDQSWYAPLPNTPNPSRDLRLRGNGLSSGFTNRPDENVIQ